MKIEPSTIRCIEQILDCVPELRDAYERHVSDNDMLLPHVFMGEVARFVVEKARENTPESACLVDKVLALLEQAYERGDDAVQNLIGVSWIENLAKVGDVADKLRNLMGPVLRHELGLHTA